MPRKTFTALDALKILAPPPPRPLERANQWAWPRVEHHLGTALPVDYRSYVQAYGSGCFARYLWPLNPFAKRRELDLVEQGRIGTDSRGRPTDPFAAEQGLRLWGYTDDGHRLYWRTDGHPDDWPVVVWRADGPSGPDHQIYPCTMTEFLYNWLQQDLVVRLFPPRSFKAIFEIHPYRA
jgi:hypothetical protein